MDVTAELVVPCEPGELFAWVEDLGRYPEWLDIVPRAVPVDAHPDDPGPAWSVDLRGQFGPFARSKRLRMVRTVHEPPIRVRFERVEHDGRQHSPWVLTADVRPHGGETAGTMQLHYGGFLGGPLVEKLLADEIERCRPRLYALVTGRPAPTPDA
jgi:Polyketide cyclase / dehydrase and lipid transport